MKHSARISDQTAAHRQPSTGGLAGFSMQARDAATLTDLTIIFADYIAAEGFDHHLCVVIPDGSGPSALFGDMRGSPFEALRIIRSRPVQPRHIEAGRSHGLLIPVQCWHDHPLFVLVTGSPDTPGRDQIARMQGFAEVYGTYGYSLFEQQQDIATNSGLGLVQRQCLALILSGYKDFEIAPILGLTPLSIRAHVHHAMTLLDADTRAEAVAIAARRGWLVGLDQLQVN